MESNDNLIEAEVTTLGEARKLCQLAAREAFEIRSWGKHESRDLLDFC